MALAEAAAEVRTLRVCGQHVKKLSFGKLSSQGWAVADAGSAVEGNFLALAQVAAEVQAVFTHCPQRYGSLLIAQTCCNAQSFHALSTPSHTQHMCRAFCVPLNASILYIWQR